MPWEVQRRHVRRKVLGGSLVCGMTDCPAQVQGHVKSTAGCVKRDRARHIVVHAVAQRLQRCARAIHEAGEPGSRSQISVIDKTGDRESRSCRVDPEAGDERLAGVAGAINSLERQSIGTICEGPE